MDALKRLTLEPWSIEDGLVTPTTKLKRAELERRFAARIKAPYIGHDAPPDRRGRTTPAHPGMRTPAARRCARVHSL
jgi:long-chain acyl-CoA synthetase